MVDEGRRAALLTALEAHKTMGRHEDAHLARMRAFAETAADPFDPTSDAGHFTASALVVSHDMDQVLLLHHRKLDKWLQCGGHIESGDADPARAALREVREETGLESASFHPLWQDLLDVDIHHIPESDAMAAHDHLDLRYLVAADPRAPLARSEAETKALKWCTWEEAAALVGDGGLQRVFQKVRRIQDAVQRSP